ncbi:hypothetical protein F5882DRAFT_389817 [Hyaloscypha sp. PMI_1271]|nr:hypothetical protein F5882DRAFT_389817 [Hyaloscypha sp. PMI_1271]
MVIRMLALGALFRIARIVRLIRVVGNVRIVRIVLLLFSSVCEQLYLDCPQLRPALAIFAHVSSFTILPTETPNQFLQKPRMKV